MDYAFAFVEQNAVCIENSNWLHRRCASSRCTAGIPRSGMVGYTDVSKDNDVVTVLKGICTALIISTQELRTGTELPQCHSVGIVSSFVLLVPHGTSDSSSRTQHCSGGELFIIVDASGSWTLNVPPVHFNTRGVSMASSDAVSYSFKSVYVARVDVDTASSINAKLEEGLHVVLAATQWQICWRTMLTLSSMVMVTLMIGKLRQPKRGCHTSR